MQKKEKKKKEEKKNLPWKNKIKTKTIIRIERNRTNNEGKKKRGRKDKHILIGKKKTKEN